MKSPDMISVTLQDRIFPDEGERNFLDTFLASFQSLKRILFSKLYGRFRPTNLNEFKRQFMKDHGITSTHYNSLKNECDGIFKSQIELQKHYRDEYRAKKKSIEEWIGHKSSVILRSEKNLECEKITDEHRRKLEKKIKFTKFKLHHKKRRLAHVVRQLDEYEKQVKLGKDFVPKIVFGSKALLKKRHQLKENGYRDALSWKHDWNFEREKSALFIGDSTEVHRNRQVKGITQVLDQDGIDLQVSIPYAMREGFGNRKNFTLKSVSLSERSRQALRECLSYSYLKEKRSNKDNSVSLKECQLPISYRIKKEKYLKKLSGTTIEEVRYYLQCIIQIPVTPDQGFEAGALGIDLNVDHLAVGITDRFGNPRECFSLAFRPYEATSRQNEAALAAMIHDLCDIAEKRQVPIVIEKLKLSILTAKLKSQHYGKTSKRLSSFSYASFFDLCERICARRKIRLIRVFAGYSSQIGVINYWDRRQRISSHEAAALVIARRGQRKKESLNISNLARAPGGQEILSQTQERLAGPATEVLKKYSKKLDFRTLKGSYLQLSPERKRRPKKLDFQRSHVFDPLASFRDSA